MQSWLAARLVSWVMARLREGDIRPTAMLDADDVMLTFPGDNSWSGVFRGKEAHRRWLERFARCGFQIFPDEVVCTGWPWRATMCIRGHDFLRSPEGETVYENRYVIWANVRWGRTTRLEVYEDTQKAKALDLWLEANEGRLVAA